MGFEDNLLNQLRLRKIFSPGPAPTPIPPFSGAPYQGIFNTPSVTAPMPNVTVPPDTGIKRYQTPALEEYRKFLSGEQAPTRQTAQLSKLGKILAITSGSLAASQGGIAHGVGLGTSLLNRPYEEALEKYTTKGGKLKEMAGVEAAVIDAEEKRDAAQREYNLKVRKQEIEEGEFKLKQARDPLEQANIRSQMAARGLYKIDNEIDGTSSIYDAINKTWTPIAKTQETVTEKEVREGKKFRREEGIRQANRKALQEDTQAHQTELERLRQRGRKSLKEFEATLEAKTAAEFGGLKTIDQRRLYDLALDQATQDNPNLEEEDPEAFNADVRARIPRLISRMKYGYAEGATGGMPQVTIPNAAPPQPTGGPSLESAARQELAKIGIMNPNQAQLSEAMRELSEQ